MKFSKEFNLSILTVVITISMQFMFIRYSSYYISKVDYGNFVLLQTLIAGLSATLLQIPGQSFDRFYNTSKNKLLFINEFRSILVFVNVIGLLLIVLYGTIYNKFSIEILSVLFVYFVVSNNYALNQKIFLLNLQRKKFFYIKILEASSKFLFPIIFYYFLHSLISIIYGMIVGYMISYLLLLIFLKDYKYKFIIQWRNLKKYFIFAYPIIFVSIFTWGISFSDRYFIDYYLSTKDVAIYSLLAIVAGVGQVVGQVYFMYAEPKILKRYEEDAHETSRMINSYILKLFLVFVVLGLIASVLPKIIYTILLEKDIIYNEYYFHTMIILLFATFLNILHIAHHMHLKLAKRLNILAYIFLIGLIVNLIGNLFIARYGIMAAAISTLVAYSVILIAQILYVWKIMPFQRSENA